jgi:hypothetical protein
MRKTHEEQVAQLRLALEIHEFGVEMMRQSLRRRHSGESAAQIEERIVRWLQSATDGFS